MIKKKIFNLALILFLFSFIIPKGVFSEESDNNFKKKYTFGVNLGLMTFTQFLQESISSKGILINGTIADSTATSLGTIGTTFFQGYIQLNYRSLSYGLNLDFGGYDFNDTGVSWGGSQGEPYYSYSMKEQDSLFVYGIGLFIHKYFNYFYLSMGLDFIHFIYDLQQVFFKEENYFKSYEMINFNFPYKFTSLFPSFGFVFFIFKNKYI